MNEMQLESIIEYVVLNYKSQPLDWTSEQNRMFCEYARMPWVIQILEVRMGDIHLRTKNNMRAG